MEVSWDICAFHRILDRTSAFGMKIPWESLPRLLPISATLLPLLLPLILLPLLLQPPEEVEESREEKGAKGEPIQQQKRTNQTSGESEQRMIDQRKKATEEIGRDKERSKKDRRREGHKRRSREG